VREQAAESQALQIGSGKTEIGKPIAAAESEPSIVGRLSQQDAASRSKPFDPAEAFPNQGTTNAAALSVGPDGNRPKGVPTIGLATALLIYADRREGNVPDHMPI
jgi:hypothetical protein